MIRRADDPTRQEHLYQNDGDEDQPDQGVDHKGADERSAGVRAGAIGSQHQEKGEGSDT